MITVQKETDLLHDIHLKNDDLEVVLSNYGCTIMKVLMKDIDGNVSDVVLGYDKIEDYQKVDGYLGAIVGRVANRIKAGQFELNGKKYDLAINNGPNHLHGGIKGFSYQVFDYEIKDDCTIEFNYTSIDQEEGYPGNLDLKVVVELKGQTLFVTYLAECDQDTLINITNHSYFNLGTHDQTIYDHELCVKASKFAAVDQDGLTTGKLLDVTNTPFDFRNKQRIGDLIEQDHEQLKIGKGYDHPFIFDQDQNQVVLYHPQTKRQLTVSTTLPQAQVYSANYLTKRDGKNGNVYDERYGICFETQNMPDAIHLEENPSTILRKGEVYEETTSYTFEVIK